jgi:hypothetical protein
LPLTLLAQLSRKAGSRLNSYKKLCTEFYDLDKPAPPEGSELIATEFEELNLRLYEQGEFYNLLASAGFSDIKTFKAYQFRDPDDADESIIFECSRP